jgi:hypothetical protein
VRRLPGDPSIGRWLLFAIGFRLPGPPWLRVAVPLFALLASAGTVAISADDVRTARLRQHGLPVPDDPDLGRPTH